MALTRISNDTLQNDTISYNKLGAEFTDLVVLPNNDFQVDVDFSTGTVFSLLADGSFYTVTFLNYNIGDVKTIISTTGGIFGIDFFTPNATIVVLNGEIDPAVDLNFIQVLYGGNDTFYLTISSLTF